jgi:hypothetical protein
MVAIRKAAESTKSGKGKAAKPAAALAASKKSYTVEMPYLQESKGGNYAVFSAPRDKTAKAVGSVYINVSELPKDSRPDSVTVTITM